MTFIAVKGGGVSETVVLQKLPNCWRNDMAMLYSKVELCRLGPVGPKP